MIERLDNAEFNQAVEALRTTDGEARKKIISRLMTDLHRSGTMRRWAASVAHSKGYRNQVGIDDDIAQVVAEKVVLALMAVGPATPSPRDWLKYLFGHAKNSTSDYLASSQVNPASRMSGATRRQRLIARARRELTARLNREPSIAEIIEYSNAWAVSEHRNAKKQGLLLSEEDFSRTLLAPVSIEAAAAVGMEVAAPEASDARSELQLVMRQIVRIARELHPGDEDLLAVIGAWAQLTMMGQRPSKQAIRMATRLSEDAVRNGLARMNVVLQEFRDFTRFREEADRAA